MLNINQIPDDNQRTKDWRIERLGCWTGSRIGALMTSGKKKDEVFGTTAKSLIYEVMAERDLSSSVIGSTEAWEEYLKLTTATSRAMQFGTDNEDDAIKSTFNALIMKANFQDNGMFSVKDENGFEQQYAIDTIKLVRTGSVPHATIPSFAASPDAVIVHEPTGDILAAIETKVPLPKTFMQYRGEIHDGPSLKAINADYYYQVHAEMMVTQTRLCIFAAYQPFLVHGLHLAFIEMCDDTAKLIEERIGLAEDFIKEHK